MVDGRSRLDSMENYFGNVLSIPYATIETDELEEIKLEVVAQLVHDCVQGAATAEHFQGLVDWVEARRPQPALTRVYCGPGNGVGDVTVVASSGRQFPVGKVEFGWGKAVFGSYHFPWGGGAGYVMPIPSTGGNGDWVVYLHIESWSVEATEAEAGDVFRRVTPEYVMLDSTTGDKRIIHLVSAGDAAYLNTVTDCLFSFILLVSNVLVVTIIMNLDLPKRI